MTQCFQLSLATPCSRCCGYKLSISFDELESGIKKYICRTCLPTTTQCRSLFDLLAMDEWRLLSYQPTLFQQNLIYMRFSTSVSWGDGNQCICPKLFRLHMEQDVCVCGIFGHLCKYQRVNSSDTRLVLLIDQVSPCNRGKNLSTFSISLIATTD